MSGGLYLLVKATGGKLLAAWLSLRWQTKNAAFWRIWHAHFRFPCRARPAIALIQSSISLLATLPTGFGCYPAAWYGARETRVILRVLGVEPRVDD
ncbi:MAG: hypothetical protein LBU45_09090 [Azoarcus sp.]|nr:hypothetical protein [Azoarcus sp.]